MHSYKAYWYRPETNAEETVRPDERTIAYMPFVSNITSIFVGTTCSVDATLIKRPVGFPFPGL